MRQVNPLVAVVLGLASACSQSAGNTEPSTTTPSAPASSTTTATPTTTPAGSSSSTPAVASSSSASASSSSPSPPPPVVNTADEASSEAQTGANPSNAGTAPSGASSSSAEPDSEASTGVEPAPTFDGKELFILFGQSNMSGFSPMPDEPWVVNDNITFMVQYDCTRLDQTKDEWLPAQPPLHGCQWATNGLGLGLGDYFGVGLSEAWPQSKIGLIPNAIPAVTIDIFMKGGPAPEGASKALPPGYTSAYTLMIDRAKQALTQGRIRGILLLQGESDFNQGFGDEWPEKVATVVADLRTDLELTEAVPFIAGEVPPTGNYSGHNVNVHKLPDLIPNSTVVTAEGTDVHDGVHYDTASVRLVGERFAKALLELSPAP